MSMCTCRERPMLKYCGFRHGFFRTYAYCKNKKKVCAWGILKWYNLVPSVTILKLTVKLWRKLTIATSSTHRRNSRMRTMHTNIDRLGYSYKLYYPESVWAPSLMCNPCFMGPMFVWIDRPASQAYHATTDKLQALIGRPWWRHNQVHLCDTCKRWSYPVSITKNKLMSWHDSF